MPEVWQNSPNHSKRRIVRPSHLYSIWMLGYQTHQMRPADINAATKLTSRREIFWRRSLRQPCSPSRPHFGSSATSSSCGRAMTCAAINLPSDPIALLPASIAAVTAATSPRTMTVT